MEDFLKFKKMITPTIIQFVFWIGVFVVIIAGIFMLREEVAAGIMMIVLGPLFIRIYAELLIVVFKINENLNEINNSLADIKHNTKQQASD